MTPEAAIAAECRHEWQCEGWTVDTRTGTCRVCGQRFVFWLKPEDPIQWTHTGWPNVTVHKL